MPTRVAALDLGSNTFLLLVADVWSDGRVDVLFDGAKIVRLAEGVELSGTFHTQALGRANDCLCEFAQTIDKFNVQQTLAMATAAARKVRNPEALLALCEKHRIPLQIISGEREAELTFLGTVSESASAETVAVVDIGGGSTELMLGIIPEGKSAVQGRPTLLARMSAPVGAVNMTEKFIHSDPPTAFELAQLTGEISRNLLPFSQETRRLEDFELIAVAGTATSLACLDLARDYTAELVDQHIIEVSNLRRIAKRLADASLAERLLFKGLERGRADIIVAGSTILLTVCQMLGVKRLTVSVRGLRYGIARHLGRLEIED